MYIIMILIGLGLIAVDQFTKIWATNVLSNGNDIVILKNIFHLHYVRNEGAAFGMLGGKQVFLIIFTSVIIVGMLYYYHKLPQTTWGKVSRVSFMMIISGAIGNLIDRIWLNYVRDFLYFKLIDFPVFNVADILVVVGVGILLVAMLFGDLDQEKEVENGR